MMDVERERRVLQHLEDALEWPGAERDARLKSALGHDPSMLADVRKLLQTADSLETLLPTEMPVRDPPEDPPPPERLGPYRLGALLGKGGMGRVYRAERADGVFEHTIAIKLMRRTRLPAQVAEQFARERQILARLQHRNIAQLLDGGVAPDGTSYFMMELVDGRPIDRYVKEEDLGLRPTLMLFRQVCSAVQYAHSLLVVHADIKPNNILVTRDGTTKLLDFGVARVVADVGDPASAPSGSLGITHFYASPERRRGDVPGTADDVYSLGVLLQELLKACRSTQPELQSICRCACAEDPAQRYAGVDAMRVDIERSMSGLPVLAHGVSWSYVTGKFLARHRVAVAAACVSVMLLATAVAALAVLYVRAEHARLEAEQRFSQVRELSHFALFDVYDELESVPRALRLRHTIAAKGQEYLDTLSDDPRAPIGVRMEIVEGLRRLALVEGGTGSPSLGLMSRASANLTRAESIARSLPDEPRYARNRSLALAQVFIARGKLSTTVMLDLAGAERALDAAEEALAPLVAAQAFDGEAHGLALDLAVERAALLQWQGHYETSIEVARKALTDPISDLQDAGSIRRRARLLDILAESTFYAGDIPASAVRYREQYELLRKLAADNPYSFRDARAFMRAGWALGSTLLQLGPAGAAEAEPLLSLALAGADELRMLEPQDKDLIRMRSVVALAEGQALAAVGRVSEALPLMEQAVRQRQTLWSESSGDWAIARDVASGWDLLGEVLANARQPARACAAFREARRVFDKMRAAGRLTRLDEDTTQKELGRLFAENCR